MKASYLISAFLGYLITTSPIAAQTFQKDLRIARDSATFIADVASNNLPPSHCLAFISSNGMSSKLGFHIDGPTGQFVKNPGENGPHVKASGTISLVNDVTSIPSHPDALYDVELNQVPHRSRPEVSQWSPYLGGGGFVLILQDPSTIKGTLDYLPDSLMILPDWMPLIDKLPDMSNISGIISKQTLDERDALALALEISKKPQLISGNEGALARNSYKACAGIARSVLISAIFDALPASEKERWNEEIASLDVAPTNRSKSMYTDLLGIKASKSYSTSSLKEKMRLGNIWKAGAPSTSISTPQVDIQDLLEAN